MQRPIFKSIYDAIFFGVIAVLIGGFTYGLGTVTLASSLFLGAFGGLALTFFANSFLKFFSKTENSNNIQSEKAYKKRFIATLVISCVFMVAAVLIATLTFGFGLIPLGTFAATALTVALASIALPNACLVYIFGKEFKSKHEENKRNDLSNNSLIENEDEETSVEQKRERAKEKVQSQEEGKLKLQGQPANGKGEF